MSVLSPERSFRGPFPGGVLHAPHDHDSEQQRADGAAGAADADAALAGRTPSCARRGQVRLHARRLPGMILPFLRAAVKTSQ
jgi:hypothetical protein